MYRTMLNTATRRTYTKTPKSLLHHQQRPISTKTRPQPRPTITTTINRQQTRPLTTTERIKFTFRDASKGIWRKNPILFPLTILSVLGSTALLGYIIYNEITYVAPQYHRFPAPVASALRTGVYYTDIDLQPLKALKAYKDALKLAIELEMHPFSDEVLGIKIQVAMMLERAGLAKPAIEVLERTKREALRWIEESRVKEGIIRGEREKGRGKGGIAESESDTAIKIDDDPDILEAQRREEEFTKFEERQRDKTLKKVVGMDLKLAELYSSDYIQDEKRAEKAQVSAVELCLKEMKHRQDLGLPVGIGESGDSSAWLSLTEIATALTELATMYTNKERHELALPLYLRALDILRVEEGDARTCKQVVLLNGASSAMAGLAQGLKPAPPQQQQQQQQAVGSREQVVNAAGQWAQKALDVAATIQPPVRDEECDVSCVAATYNLGELAEMLDQRDEAGKRYKEAKSLARSVGFEDGVAMADSALKRLGKQKR